jgi:hypothetical protein
LVDTDVFRIDAKLGIQLSRRIEIRAFILRTNDFPTLGARTPNVKLRQLSVQPTIETIPSAVLAPKSNVP